MMDKQSAQVKRFRLPPTYFNLSWITMTILHFTVPVYYFLPIPYNLTGILLMLPGLWMNMWASNYFNKVNTTVKPFQTSTHLVTTGFYRISRHPMYLGMLLILLGIFLLLGSLTPFIVIPVYIALINRKFILPEEKMLLKTFGEDYKNYTQKVRRWI
jgi:protein-S-isoprenylcysteine O-methyltransferase Ste14